MSNMIQDDAIKVIDKIDSRYYIIRMNEPMFKLYGFDQYGDKTPYQITMESLDEAYQAK